MNEGMGLDKQTNRRSTTERRIFNDSYYIGRERRSGFDARGGKIIKKENNQELNSGEFDWLFDKSGANLI